MTKTWKQRIAESNQHMPQDIAMQAEINELRAALEVYKLQFAKDYSESDTDALMRLGRENAELREGNERLSTDWNLMLCELESLKKDFIEVSQQSGELAARLDEARQMILVGAQEVVDLEAKLASEKASHEAWENQHLADDGAQCRQIRELEAKLAEQTELAQTTWEQLEVRQRIIDELLAKIESYESQQPSDWTWIGRKGWKEYGEIPHDTYQCTPLYRAPGAKTETSGESLYELAVKADNGGQP